MDTPFPTNRLSEFSCLDAQDIARVKAIAGPPRTIARHGLVRSEGSKERCVYLLIDGWASSSLVLRDGNRQIVKLHLPGDILGATSMAIEEAVDSVTALTPVTVSRIELDDLGHLMATMPGLAAFLLLSAQKERIALIDRLAAVAQQAALARVAGALIDLHDRLSAIGAVRDATFELAITQEQLGDYLGLTPVHVNRMLRQLDDSGMIARHGRSVQVRNEERLRGVASAVRRRFLPEAAWLSRNAPARAQPAADAPLRR